MNAENISPTAIITKVALCGSAGGISLLRNRIRCPGHLTSTLDEENLNKILSGVVDPQESARRVQGKHGRFHHFSCTLHSFFFHFDFLESFILKLLLFFFHMQEAFAGNCMFRINVIQTQNRISASWTLLGSASWRR